MSSHLQESRAPSCVIVMWEDKPHHFECPPCPPPSRSLYAERDVVWRGVSFWPVWVSCLSCVPSQLPVHLAALRSWKVLDCLATTKNISVLPTLFSSQIQNTALHQLPERKLTLSQLKPPWEVEPTAISGDSWFFTCLVMFWEIIPFLLTKM